MPAADGEAAVPPRSRSSLPHAFTLARFPAFLLNLKHMNKLDTLLKSAECEVVEFKEAKVSFDFDKLGHYFSAICNEARLKGKRYGYLVFGVNDKREVVGSNYRVNGGLDSLTREVADKTTGRTTFSDIHEYVQNGKRVVEGRKPNIFLSQPMAVITGEKAEYSRNKALDQQYYLDFICKAIGEHKMMTRKDIDNLLWTKISDVLDEKQNKKKIDNLLSHLRRFGRIRNQGGCKKPEWVLS